MALIKYAESTVLGLVGDLAALRQADAAETSNRIAGELATALVASTALTAEYDARVAAMAQEVLDRNSAIDSAASVVNTALLKEVSDRLLAVSTEETARIAGDTALSLSMSTQTGDFSSAKATLDIVNGDNTVVGSFRKAIADVVDGAPVAMDTLKKIADYISVNPDANVADAITSHVDAAVAALKGDVTSAMDTLGEVETAIADEASARNTAVSDVQSTLIGLIETEVAARELAILTEIAARDTAISVETAARATSESDLNTALRAYANSVAAQGGSIPVLESALVTGDSIILANAPKAGINGVLNFGTVRYVDGSGVAYDAPILNDATDTTGKTFTIAVDTSGQWNGLSVSVQYVYNIGA
jgi:hypothetical protein